MTRDPNPAPEPHKAGPATGPMVVWVSVQLAALGLAALRIPLAAKYRSPEEALAPHLLLIAQLAASAMLFPYLLSDRLTSVAILTAAWPFAAVASALSGLPARQMALGEAYVTAWLVGLAVWRAILCGGRLSLYGVAVASMITLGGTAAWYLSLEFAAREAVVGGSGARTAVFPTLGALGQLRSDKHDWLDWLTPLLILSGALFVMGATRFFRRDRLSTIATPAAPAEGPITS